MLYIEHSVLIKAYLNWTKTQKKAASELRTILSCITIGTGFGLWEKNSPWSGVTNIWCITKIQESNCALPNLYRLSPENELAPTKLFPGDKIISTAGNNQTRFYRHRCPMLLRRPKETRLSNIEELDLNVMIPMVKLITQFEYTDKETIVESIMRNRTVIRIVSGTSIW